MGSRVMSISRALEHHRAGRLSDAEKIYASLLQDRPEDADVAGLLGILALQKGRHDEAERRLTDALRMRGADQITVRNLNALAYLYYESGRHEAARSVIRLHLPPDTIEAPASAGEAGAFSSLASCAFHVGEIHAAQRLADAIEMSPLAPNPEAVDDLAVLFARLGRSSSLERLVEAAGINGGAPPREFWMKIGHIADEHKHPAISALAQTRICRDFPFLLDPADPIKTRPCRVLVLNWQARFSSPDPRECYNSSNAIGALAAIHEETLLAFDTLLIKEVDVETIPRDLPGPQIVFNNLANAELNVLADNTMRTSRIANSFGVPVLNDPAIIATTTRESNYHRLKDIPGLVYPKTTTFFLHDEPASGFTDSIIVQFGLPVVVRSVIGHEGKNIYLCRSRDDLIAAVEAFRGRYFYAIEFIDAPFAKNIWRKFRMACINGRLFGHKLSFGGDWMVNAASWRQLAAERPDLQAEEQRFLADPTDYLPEPATAALVEIQRRTPLDYFGIDFTVDASGRLVVFEVNAAMRTLPSAGSRSPLAYLTDTRARIQAAFEEMLLSRATGGASEPATGGGAVSGTE